MASRSSPAELLENNNYCVLSTASCSSVPWSTPLFYAYDSHWRLYWISARSSHHSRLLEENHQACVVIYELPGVADEAAALYLSGEVAVCVGDDIDHALTLLSERAGLGISGNRQDYQGSSPCRLYRLLPKQGFMLGDADWEDNLLLDQRTEVELPA